MESFVVETLGCFLKKCKKLTGNLICGAVDRLKILIRVIAQTSCGCCRNDALGKPLLLLYSNQLKYKQIFIFFFLCVKPRNLLSQHSAASKGNLIQYTCIQVAPNLFRGQMRVFILRLFCAPPLSDVTLGNCPYQIPPLLMP